MPQAVKNSTRLLVREKEPKPERSHSRSRKKIISRREVTTRVIKQTEKENFGNFTDFKSQCTPFRRGVTKI